MISWIINKVSLLAHFPVIISNTVESSKTITQNLMNLKANWSLHCLTSQDLSVLHKAALKTGH